MKECTKCKIEKELDQFNKRSSSKDGRRASCRSCDLEYVNSRKAAKREYDKARYKEKSDHIKMLSADYYSKNKEKVNIKNKKWQKENKKRFDEYQKTYKLENKEKELIKKREYWKTPRGRFINKNKSAKRRAAKLNATLEGYDIEIKEIYKNCPEGYHVDHIMPLVNSNLCGLHVPWNLQYLPAEENLKKGNRIVND